ncbi:transmembrane and coiled-coil domains protein 1-like [Girardinichthys multiradiatus]|uniref:transmembrane and coiled-coil domains protein 1-like n=1 Tax=Girardinichthys multiradiatus TaxID=208333 RepID=UPI001FAE1E3E|nr:transmembrane and coiled-coil domains protein 1-like [Girardinichthys multiradiatus]
MSRLKPVSQRDMDEVCENEDGSQMCSSSVCADTFQSSQTQSSDSNRSTAFNEDEYPGLDSVIYEIQEVRKIQKNLEKCLQALQTTYHQDHIMIHQALEEEKSRWNLLEQKLIDQTELNQRETEDLKEEITSTKEMIEYQSNDRIKEFFVELETCQNHLLRLELQQQQQVHMETPEEITAQTILGKVIKGLLVVTSALLAFVCTVSHAVLFFKSSSQILSTLLLAVLLLLIIKYFFQS